MSQAKKRLRTTNEIEKKILDFYRFHFQGFGTGWNLHRGARHRPGEDRPAGGDVRVDDRQRHEGNQEHVGSERDHESGQSLENLT